MHAAYRIEGELALDGGPWVVTALEVERSGRSARLPSARAAAYELKEHAALVRGVDLRRLRARRVRVVEVGASG